MSQRERDEGRGRSVADESRDWGAQKNGELDSRFSVSENSKGLGPVAC